MGQVHVVPANALRMRSVTTEESRGYLELPLLMTGKFNKSFLFLVGWDLKPSALQLHLGELGVTIGLPSRPVISRQELRR